MDFKLPKSGEYWRATKADDWPVGELAIIVEVDAEKLSFVLPGHHCTNCKIADFLEEFEFEPNGEQNRQAEVSALLTELSNFNLKQRELTLSMTSLETSTTAIQTTNSLQQKKHEISLVRAKVSTLAEDLVKKQTRLNAMIEAQKTALEAKIKPMEELIERLNESVFTINLYLGTDEEIVQIVKGEPAPATEKVFIRQNVLYMEDECAIIESEGMDFRQIEKFDRWIAKPKNRDIVIPEKRAVVVLRVCRPKDYADPWLTQEYNKENRKTYFLIRNGEALFRIYSELNVGEYVFPIRSEFDDLLFATVKDDFGRPTEKIIKPGTKEYNERMKEANAKNRHYMRILLILQGLFDRTPVFHPLAGPVNVMDRREQNDVFEFVHDAEMLLSDGRVRFEDWLLDINSRLTVGSRIIGNFHSYNRRPHESRSKGFPGDKLELYTLEKRDENGYLFYFSSEYRTNRLSYLIYPTDNFVLNVDEAKVEDMEYYINCRLDRRNFMEMIPLMQLAIKIKQKEAKAEEPFKKLLLGKMLFSENNIHKLGQVEVEKHVDDLVFWFKFKNKIHRALSKDDELAYRMILEEFRIRMDALHVRSDNNLLKLAEAIRQADPSVIYVGHKKDEELVSYSACNNENIFLREKIWKRGKVIQDKDWTLLDKRYMRWHALYISDRWKAWPQDLRIRDYLTDPERQMLVAKIGEEAPNHYDDIEGPWHREGAFKGRKRRFLPLAAKMNWFDHTLRLYFSPFEAVLPTTGITVTRAQEPVIVGMDAKYKREADGQVSFVIGKPNSADELIDRFASFRNSSSEYIQWPWKKWTGKKDIIYWTDEAAINLIKKEVDEGMAINKKAYEFDSKALHLISAVRCWLRETEELKFKEEFLKDNHPMLWDAHRKKLDIKIAFNAHGLDDLIAELLEVGENLEGKTIAQMLEAYKKAGFKRKLPKELAAMPRDLVLKYKENRKEDWES